MARRLVAGFDGVDDYITFSAPTAFEEVEFTVCFWMLTDEIRNTVITETNAIAGWSILTAVAAGKLTVGVGSSNLDSTNVVTGTGFPVHVALVNSVAEGRKLYIDGVEDSGFTTTYIVPDYTAHAASYIGSRNSSAAFDGEVWSFKFFDYGLTSAEVDECMADTGSLVCTAHLPLEGNNYDVSGNGNHGTNNGADLTATYTDTTDGVYSYNLQKGYGYKVDGTTLVPRLADNSDWADTGVVDERPAGFWHNEATAWINFPNTFTDDIWDKSDTAIWKDTVRASVYYDSGNVRLWHPSELTLDYLSSNINAAYISRLFCWDTESEWVKNGDYHKQGDHYVYAVDPEADLTRMQNLLAYDTRIEDPALIKTVKYLDKKGGSE